MKVVILGAGQVGGSVAKHLAAENHEVTVVDIQEQALSELREHADLRTIQGIASNPQILEEAGVRDAEVLIAVTNSDEVNIVASIFADKVFQVQNRIVRIRTGSYLKEPYYSKLLEGFSVSDIISPEKFLIDFIENLVNYPGASEILNFADGQVQLLGLRVHPESPLVQRSIGEIKQYLRQKDPSLAFRITGIFRRQQSLNVNGNTTLHAGDELLLLTERNFLRTLLHAFHPEEHQYRRIMIAGGGNIGRGLAKALETRKKIKIVEKNPQNAEKLQLELQRALVLVGSATDEQLLADEYISEMQLFIAVTDDDDSNIFSAIMAKRLAPHIYTIALVNSPAYAYLADSGIIDLVIAPQQITFGAVLGKLRQGTINTVYSLRRGNAEAIEFTVLGSNSQDSRVIGRSMDKLKLPPGVRFGAVVQNNKVHLQAKDLILQAEDRVILLIQDKRRVREVERMFQVQPGYF